MDEMVIFIGTFRIRDYDRWLPAIEQMTEFVRAHVPRIRSFQVYVAVDGTAGTVVYVHPDADSLNQHLAAAAEKIRDGSQMVEVDAIRLLGAPDEATVERLRQAGTPVSVQRLVDGFMSSGAP